MLNEHTKFWINTWEVSVCKEWISLQGLLLMWQVLAEPLNPSGLSGDRGDSSNWPWGQDSTSDKAIPPAEQGRCVAPAVYVSVYVLCFLGEPRGSARLAWDHLTQCSSLCCGTARAACISTGSLKDIPGSPWQGRVLRGIPEWTCCRLSNAFLDLCDKDSGNLSSVWLCLLW